MQEKKTTRGKDVCMVFVPFIITFIVQNLLSIFFMQISLVNELVTYESGTYTDFVSGWIDSITDVWFIECVLVGYAAICTVLFFVMYKKLRSQEKQFKVFRPGIASNVPLMILGLIVVAIASQYVSGFMIDAFGSVFPEWIEEYSSLLEESGFGDNMPVLLLFYAIILGPICEELAFRGLTLKYARKFMSPAVAVVSQAILFAGFHMNKLQATFTFVIGLILGYVMIKYDNLIVTILLHIMYNLLGSVVTALLPSGGDTVLSYFCWLLGSLIVLYGGILILKKAAPEVNNEQSASDM